ncbi:MAG: ABC transporter ATP-binding protein [Acidimicrobiales bacterium]|nr:ABC transporter ATP-binding protein [Acidimicrobiales bacterium]
MRPTEPGSPVLAVEDLVVSFPTDDGVVDAVRGVSWELSPGRVLGVVGESGSGKSVTANAIMGLLPASATISGSARFQGEELLDQDDRELAALRGSRLAMIFQDPMTSLNPVYRVGWQISEAVRLHDDVSKADARGRAIELLDLVGIPDASERVDNYPHELSGGMRQRVVIAIAMANEPEVIIADEPTTALDVTVQAQVLDALATAREAAHAAMVLITHDLGVVAGSADDVVVMYAGRAVEVGSVDDVFYIPRHPYTLGLLGSLPRMDASEARRLTPIGGVPPSMIGLAERCQFAPRCPLATDICWTEEPELERTEGGTHRSACHHWRSLRGVEDPSEVFTPVDVHGADDGAGAR